MDMNRRKVLLGMGTAAIGSGAAFGSGAFTQMTADRSASITVQNDANGLVALTEGSEGSVSEFISTNSNGELTINLSGSEQGTPEGVNSGGSFQIGGSTSSTNIGTSTDDGGTTYTFDSTPAFKIKNNMSNGITVGFANNFSQTALGSGTQTIGQVVDFNATKNVESPSETDLIPSSDNSSLGTSIDLAAKGENGDTAAIVIYIDTSSIDSGATYGNVMSAIKSTLNLKAGYQSN